MAALNRKYNDFVIDVINKKIASLGSSKSQTGACKILSKNLGVSFATLYNIIQRKKPCSSKTAWHMIDNGWFNASDVGLDAKTAAKNAKARAKAKIQASTSNPTSSTIGGGTETLAQELYRKLDEAKAQGFKDGKSQGYSCGYRDGKAEGYKSGYEVGFKNGQAIIRPAARSSSSSINSASRKKLEQLLRLKEGNDSAGEAVAATTAASKVLAKIIAEEFGVSASVSIN